jgi:hypothetical protein
MIPRTLSTQTIIFQDIDWKKINLEQKTKVYNLASKSIDTSPAGLADSGDPYWIFNYEVNSSFGLKITDIKGKNTEGNNNEEPVINLLEFLELRVEFTDNSKKVNFNLVKAFQNPKSSFIETENGTLRIKSSYNPFETPDSLFQRGLLLTLVEDFGGKCEVIVELSIVFRGSFADFDPGDVPVAMKLYPHASYKWNVINEGGISVRSFHCLIKSTVANYMSHDMTNMPAGASMPPMENVAGFYADSNTSMDDDRQRSNENWFSSYGARLINKPLGWAMVFDYIKKVTKESEIIAVYGPEDLDFLTERKGEYTWDNDFILKNKISLAKAPRQGMYDNIHVHAKMPDYKDDTGASPWWGVNQIHAPFCGHSCIHMHWRWSKISVDGSIIKERGNTYKGWGKIQYRVLPELLSKDPIAFSTINAPLIPPTHRLVVAVTNPQTNRFSESKILNPTTYNNINGLNKSIWYSIDIINPNKGIKHVIMEHGFGWAYKYNWNIAVDGLTDALEDELPVNFWQGSDDFSQKQLSDFFEQSVYPRMRYFDIDDQAEGEQVPDGSYIGDPGDLNPKTMEDL